MSGAPNDDKGVSPETAASSEAPAPSDSPPGADTTLADVPPPPLGMTGEEAEDSVGAAARTADLGGEGITARFAGRTAVGLVREHNEDNLVIADLSSAERKAHGEVFTEKVGERGLMFAVCDGMGGAAAGEVASQMAVDILYEAMGRGEPPRDRDALARGLVSAVEEAGKRIFDEAQNERSKRGMGTTSTVCVLIDKVLFVAEVGDSRAYLLRQGVMKLLTKDQSLVNQLIEAGHLTEEEAEAFEHSNIILQALGTAESVQVDLTFVELRKGDRLMVCSDGLSGLVHGDTICQAMEEIDDTDECCKTLIEYAEAGGGHDNITVIVADFGGDELDESTDAEGHGYMQYPLPLEQDDAGAFDDDETTASGTELAAAMGVDGAEGSTESSSAGGSSAMWYVAGVVALLLGAAAMAVTGGTGDAVPEPVGNQVEPAPEVPAPAPELLPEPQEAALVMVHVHTDVENATLLVNGEVSGPLSQQESRSMELVPGAYRFEAQSDNDSVAVSVVTVREGLPLDVFLRMPLGSTETAQGAEPVPEPSADPEASDDPAEPVAKKDARAVPAQQEPKAAEPKAAAPKAAEPKAAEPKAAEPKAAEPRAAEPKGASEPAEEAPAAEEKPAAAKQAIPDNPF